MAFLRSVVLSEKKATSEPDIKAEETRSKIISKIFKTIA
jgi:hypothetical protein